MNQDRKKVEAEARDYYDSTDADNFYFRIWGGEDLHIGWYDAPDESIFDASRRTVEKIASRLEHLPEGAKVLDIGAGYGGSARHLAATRGWRMTALNLSVVQNNRDRQMNKDQGLDQLIEVVDGTFEELPFEDEIYDAVWCQDSILHSGDRKKVFEEAARVLKPGGDFIFTDPMEKGGIDRETLAPVLARIKLSTLGSLETYQKLAEETGFKTVEIEEKSEMLVLHYGRVLQELDNRTDEMLQYISPEYIENMKKGLRAWVDSASKGALVWGILHFRKLS